MDLSVLIDAIAKDCHSDLEGKDSGDEMVWTTGEMTYRFLDAILHELEHQGLIEDIKTEFTTEEHDPDLMKVIFTAKVV